MEEKADLEEAGGNFPGPAPPKIPIEYKPLVFKVKETGKTIFRDDLLKTIDLTPPLQVLKSVYQETVYLYASYAAIFDIKAGYSKNISEKLNSYSDALKI